MSFPIASPRQLTSGIVIFARVLSKIRLHAAGQVPPGYHLGLIDGIRTFDDRLCKFLRIDFSALTARTLAGGTDEEVLEWCFSHGHRPDPEQIEIWNGFLIKRGWRDTGTPGLLKNKIAANLAHREDILTYFDLMDAEEGRPFQPSL